MTDVLVQTVLPPRIAAWVKRRAAVEGISQAAWLRRLILQEQQSVTVRAWVPNLRTGAIDRVHHDLVLERVGAEVDGTTQFRVLEPDGAKPCIARRVLETDLFRSIERNGVFLDGSRAPWRVVSTLADAGADGQLVMFLNERATVVESTEKQQVLTLTTSDGAVFRVEEKSKADGPYYEVRDRGDFVLGRIRLPSPTKAECMWDVSVLDTYSAEIVEQLRVMTGGPMMDDVIEILMKASGALGIRPSKPFHDVHDFEAHVLQAWPAAGEQQKKAQLRYVLQAVREAEAHRAAGAVACLRQIKSLS
jgi:hypothetical protein